MNDPPIDFGNDVIGYCSSCERPILPGDKYYRMPDGFLVCDDYECLEDWAQDYERR